MSVEYLAQARTSIQAIADGSPTDWETADDKVVPVSISSMRAGVKVFTARITMNVKMDQAAAAFRWNADYRCTEETWRSRQGPAISPKDFAKSQKRKSPE